jgi:hypothetical protein
MRDFRNGLRGWQTWLAVTALLGAVACDDGGSGGEEDASLTVVDAGPVAGPEDDSDLDTIPDLIEGFPDRDSDGDGQPDYLDTDADGDSIFDSIEAGDDDLLTPPVDTDGDGTPDFRDLDSDGNGLIDRVEGPGDFDLDEIRDFADTDDDDDRIPDSEEIGDGAFPRDTDADGAPDFRDVDSDADTIADRAERVGTQGNDSDGDGIPDKIDLDSDDDGIPDAEEAGDADLETAPIDTDGDGTPDYLDLDSDGDGLTDAFELESGSSPTAEDTDGDTVPDLIEIGAGTDPTDFADNPLARGDFVFVVPFREEAQPPQDTLRFRTNIRRLDSYFLIDTTGSMGGEISAMRARTVEIIDGLSCTTSEEPCTNSDVDCGEGEVCSLEGFCIEDPEITNCIPDLWTGLGIYAGGGNTYRNVLNLQPDPAVTQEAVPGQAQGLGDRESLFEAIGCTADPTVCFGAVCGTSGVGCPAYRRDAVRVIVAITDDIDNCNNDARAPGTDPCVIVRSAGEAGGRLALQRIRFLGVDADFNGRAEPDLRAIGIASNSVDSMGNPFYFEGDSSLVVNAVIDGIRQLAAELALFVDIEARDIEGDDGDSLQFINRLEINTTTFGCSDPGAYADTNGDGFDDSFSSLRTGTPVCWDVLVRNNARVQPLRDRPQVFLAQLEVFGDGSPLDRRRVFFLVPPAGSDEGPD